MKIKSALVTQMSGSVGGITGAHNQGGLYFRGRSIPVNPSTAQQQAIRDALTVLTSRWNDVLTESQREAWRTYNQNVPIVDRLGEARPIGAVGHYVRSNTPRIQAGLDVVDDAPTVFDLGSFSTPTLAISEGDPYTVDVTFDEDDAWVDESGSAMLVYASRQQSPSINFFKGPYRFADLIEGDDSSPPSSPATINAPFPGSADNSAFVQIRVSRADGRLSGTFRGKGTIS